MRACLFSVEGAEMAGRTFAVPVAHVVEFFGASVLTPVPTAPPEVAGVTWRRGRVLPVLHLPGQTGRVSPGQSLLTLSVGDLHVALPIDRVLDLVDLDPDEAKPAGDAPSWVRALLRPPEASDVSGPVHLIDLEALVADWKARLEAAA